MPFATCARVDFYLLYVSIEFILFFFNERNLGFNFHLSNDRYNLLSLKYDQLRVKSVN